MNALLIKRSTIHLLEVKGVCEKALKSGLLTKVDYAIGCSRAINKIDKCKYDVIIFGNNLYIDGVSDGYFNIVVEKIFENFRFGGWYRCFYSSRIFHSEVWENKKWEYVLNRPIKAIHSEPDDINKFYHEIVAILNKK